MMTTTANHPDAGRVALGADDLATIQSIVTHAPKQVMVRYLFFEVVDPTAARHFVEQFGPGGALAVATAPVGGSRPVQPLFVGFSALGLAALGLSQAHLGGCPREFLEGASQRAGQLGDTGSSAPEHWVFAHDRVHIVVLVYADDADRLEARATQVTGAATGCVLVMHKNGARLEHRGDANARLQREHFGFADGISQPRLRGVPRRREKPTDQRPDVAPGLFVLGHPEPPAGADASGADMSRSITCDRLPDPAPFWHNGSFAALRIMEQDCDAFERFLDTHNPSGTAYQRELLAARMIGRWKDGTPLALCPAAPAGLPQPANDFDYSDDPKGVKCPIGSHARRANPRATTVMGGNGNAVRLIRRGMPYGPIHVRGDGVERGTLGLFFCASLKHQFEFVLKHWINDGLFARGLSPDEKDPLAGAQDAGAPFSYQTSDGTVTVDGLSRFVRTRGAAYLFFPSTTGLHELFQMTDPQAPQGIQGTQGTKTASPGAAFVPRKTSEWFAGMSALLAARATRMRSRDAHAKHHGIVRAWFNVLPVPGDLGCGVFAAPGRFPAYVRFSNGTVVEQPKAPANPLDTSTSSHPAPRHDAIPDARGMAIKVMGVSGAKLLDDERHTQDFLLANHPTFFAGGLIEYATILANPRRFPHLAASFHSHESPLSTRYFSQTVYALGRRLVRYVSVPIDPQEQPYLDGNRIVELVTQPAKVNYLRDAMIAHLSEKPARFAFYVQVPADPGAVGVDDAAITWDAPLVQVAEIEIPVQRFDSPAQMDFAETISFNPWHALEAHRPCGAINEARRAIYLATAAARRGNALPPEPDGNETF